jgi:ATP-dependent Clp protease protease subunit
MILICGDKRFGYRHSTPLYHQVSLGFYGKVKDMEERLEEGKRLQKKIEEITLDRTRIPKKKLKDILKNKIDWHMTADEALELGVIDGII